MMGGNERCGGTVAVTLLMAVLSGTALQCAEPVKTAKLVKTFDIPGDVVSLAPSPDGKLIAMTRYSLDGKAPLTVWDLATGKQVANLNDVKRPFVRSRATAFSPDGKFLVAVRGSNLLHCPTHVWDTSTWRIVRRFEKDGVTGGWNLAFSPNGRLLATSHRRDRRLFPTSSAVYLWDMKTYNLKIALDMGRNDARDVVFSGNGKYLACSTGRHVYVWDTETFRPHVISPAEGKYIGSPRFSHNGKSLLVRESTDLRVLETATWREKKRLHIGQFPRHIACLPNSQYVAVSYAQRQKDKSVVVPVVVYDYETAREVMTVTSFRSPPPSPSDIVFGGVDRNINAMAPSANGDFLYLVRERVLSIWDLKKMVKGVEE